jgi:hypothetical protein
MAIPKEQRRNRVIRQIRILGLSTLAVFAVGVIMSASASAHGYFVCKEGGTEKYTEHLCTTKGETGKWSWIEMKGSETAKVEGTSGTSKLEGEVANIKVVIECKKDTFTGEIGEKSFSRGPDGKGEYTFSECGISEIGKTSRADTLLTHCTIPSIVFKVTDKVITGQGYGTEEEFNSKSGVEELFTTVKIEGASCILEGQYKLEDPEGSEVEIGAQISVGQVCALPEADIGKVEHEIVCPQSGSHLTFDAKPASLSSTEKVKLTSGASWAVE